MEAYLFTIGSLMGISCITALGLNVISGYAGQFHLGIAVYVGVGAYCTALLTKSASVPFLASLPISTATAALFAGATGLFALRVREDALTVITIAMSFVFESLLINLPYFGGSIGIPGIPRPSFLASPGMFFLCVVVLTVLSVFVTRWLTLTWLGLAWRGIREDEEASQVIGISPGRSKVLAFVVGGGFAGLSGVLYAHMMHYVAPADFGFLPSIYVMAMVVFGGLGTILGPVLGAAFLTAMPEIFRFVQEYRNLIYGGLLVVMMLWQPGGLVGSNGLFAGIRRWAKRRIKSAEAAGGDRY
jgi:branched-chain amino acid transport system permease protein